MSVAVVGPGMVRIGTRLILRPEEVCKSQGWPETVANKVEASMLGLKLFAASRGLTELQVMDGPVGHPTTKSVLIQKTR